VFIGKVFISSLKTVVPSKKTNLIFPLETWEMSTFIDTELGIMKRLNAVLVKYTHPSYVKSPLIPKLADELVVK